jgi:hypothetical protein
MARRWYTAALVYSRGWGNKVLMLLISKCDVGPVAPFIEDVAYVSSF